ncbi:MAG: hypothetical protein ACI7YS_02735 [Flavobacterium sp.]
MKKILILFFITSSILTYSQVQKISTIPFSNQKAEAEIYAGNDALENDYYIKNNVFFKNNKSITLQYKNPFLGKISRVDLQNPLKTMLFYGDFNSVILLDNQLNETEKINFSQNEKPIDATAIGMASQNKLWIFNTLTQQIGLFDYLNNTFHSITQPLKGSFKYYETDFNYFHWIDQQNNWYFCDIFGKISANGKVPDFNQIQLLEKQRILYSKDDQLFFCDLKTNKVYEIENIGKSLKSFSYKDQILAIFANSQISKYKIILP